MTPAGLHQSHHPAYRARPHTTVRTTTGANPLSRCPSRHRSPASARSTRRAATSSIASRAHHFRIYDLGFHEETLLETDKLFSALLLAGLPQKKMTRRRSSTGSWRDIARIEDALGIKSPSLIATAYRHGVPIFVGAGAGRLILQHQKLKRLYGADLPRSTSTTTSSRWARCSTHCFGTMKKKMAIRSGGGAVPEELHAAKASRSSIRSSAFPTHGLTRSPVLSTLSTTARQPCPAGRGHLGKVSGSVQYGSIPPLRRHGRVPVVTYAPSAIRGTRSTAASTTRAPRR